MEPAIIQIAKVESTIAIALVPLIQRAIDQSSDAVSVQFVLNEIEANRAILWYVQGKAGAGIVVTSLLAQGNAVDLFIWLLAGKAISAQAQDIQKVLEHYAKTSGCRAIKAVVTNDKLLSVLLNKFDYEHAGHVVIKELKNVQPFS